MAKDPAMLWYWSDWHSGTILLSRFLKGCYMDILNAQFNFGPLSLEEIKTCLGSDFGTSWPTLQKKFKQTANGLFFNERLEEEKRKRKNYCESRRKNKEKKTYDVSHDEHMMQHMENENENVNTNVITEIIKKPISENNFLWTDEIQKFYNDFNWIFKFCNTKSVSKANCEIYMKEYIKDIDLCHDYKPLENLQDHFVKWFNKYKKNGNVSGFRKTNHSSGANELIDDIKGDFDSFGPG